MLLSKLEDFRKSNSLNVSEEVIKHQVKSKFAQEMIDLFQKVIDFRDDLILRGELSNTDIINRVVDYHHSIVPKEFKQIVAKYVNMEITQFTSSSYPCINFAIMMYLGDGLTGNALMHDINQLSTGESDFVATKQVINIGQELSKLVDRTTGKLLAKNLSVDGVKYSISSKVLFDPYIAYLSRLSVSHTVEDLTAAEIAGIMMHEVGHCISAVDNAHECMKTKLELGALFSQIDTSSMGISELSNTVRDINTARVKLEAQTGLSNRLLDRAVDTVLALSKETSLIARTGGVVYVICRTVISILMVSFIALLIYFLKQLIWGPGPRNFKESFVVKKSDHMKTDQDISRVERRADEFSSRHGFYADNISTDRKLQMYVNIVFSSASSLKNVRESRIAASLLQFQRMAFTIILGDDSTGFGAYEDPIKRAYSYHKDLLTVFKSDLSPQLADMYIAEVKRADKELNLFMKQQKTTQQLISLRIVLEKCISLQSIVKLITTGNIDSAYAKFISALEDINASRLNYLSYKLEQVNRR